MIVDIGHLGLGRRDLCGLRPQCILKTLKLRLLDRCGIRQWRVLHDRVTTGGQALGILKRKEEPAKTREAPLYFLTSPLALKFHVLCTYVVLGGEEIM